jgi:hypothetical protein
MSMTHTGPNDLRLRSRFDHRVGTQQLGIDAYDQSLTPFNPSVRIEEINLNQSQATSAQRGKGRT